MKKLLSFLSVMALSVTIIPTSTAVITYKETIPSTVQIQIDDSVGNTFIGSGVVISLDAYILTSSHVIIDANTNEPAKDIYICLVANEYEEPSCKYKAEVIAYDTNYDLALIIPKQHYDEKTNKVTEPIAYENLKTLNLTYTDFADVFPSLGEKISILGYPQASTSGTIILTEGSISGFIPLTKNIIWYIITDATGNPGNSGGPAYNAEEKLIGILESISTEGEGGNYSYITSEDVIATWFNKLVDQEILNKDFVSDIFTNDFLNNGPADTNIFTDVDLNQKNAEAISYLKNTGIINGYKDGSFKPENSLNRAELLKILVEGAGYNPDEKQYKNCFTDVKEEWFAKHVCYAKEKGWISGYNDGTFKPANNVSKVESLKMLLEVFNIVPKETNVKPFKDIDMTQWYAKYVSKAKELGILEETSNFYKPEDNMIRGSISENIYRFMIMEKELFTNAMYESTCAIGAQASVNPDEEISSDNHAIETKVREIFASYGFNSSDDAAMEVLISKYENDKDVEIVIINSIEECNTEALEPERESVINASYEASCELSKSGKAPYSKTLEMLIETGNKDLFQDYNLDVNKESVKEHLVTTYNEDPLVQSAIDNASNNCSPSI